jgi:hypothetical protein
VKAEELWDSQNLSAHRGRLSRLAQPERTVGIGRLSQCFLKIKNQVQHTYLVGVHLAVGWVSVGECKGELGADFLACFLPRVRLHNARQLRQNLKRAATRS